MDWNAFFSYIVARLCEKTTWVSLGTMLTGIGVALKPDQWQAIMAIGMGVSGFISTVLPARVLEKNVTPAPAAAPPTPLAQSLADNNPKG